MLGIGETARWPETGVSGEGGQTPDKFVYRRASRGLEAAVDDVSELTRDAPVGSYGVGPAFELLVPFGLHLCVVVGIEQVLAGGSLEERSVDILHVHNRPRPRSVAGPRRRTLTLWACVIGGESLRA